MSYQSNSRLWTAIVLMGLLLSSCGSGDSTSDNEEKDTTKPSISILSPVNGDLLSGSVTISTEASDNVGVSKVEFYIDDVLVSTDIDSPFSYELDTFSLSNAAHTIMATAYDAANNKQSDSISVTVNNTFSDITNPVVNITTPSSGAVISGIVTYTAAASDNIESPG